MDTEHLNDPESFTQYTNDPVALDMIRALGEVMSDESSDPAVGFAVYRVEHDGWRISQSYNEPKRWYGNKKFGKGKRVSQIKRAMNILCEHNILASWEWTNVTGDPNDPTFHIRPGDKWGDIHAEQAKREKARADKEAVARMHGLQIAREKMRRSRAEVHRAKEKLLLEDIPALVEYIKSVDPDQSTPEWGWDTAEHTLRSTFNQMERAMSDRKSNEEWMMRYLTEEA